MLILKILVDPVPILGVR